MREYLKFYIDGKWVDPIEPKIVETINPATEQVPGRVEQGSTSILDKTVIAARKAFTSWSKTSCEERLADLHVIQAECQKRMGDLGAAVLEDMGAPKGLANAFHVCLGAGHLNT